MLGLKLNADWVVLSACNTASGDVKNEEALSGLGRAFFFAGSRRLLVSYWSVETVSARLLTTELFKRQPEHPEESKAEALSHSMLKLMNSSKDYSHPAFWAPFGLIGDAAKKRQRRNSEPPRRPKEVQSHKGHQVTPRKPDEFLGDSF